MHANETMGHVRSLSGARQDQRPSGVRILWANNGVTCESVFDLLLR